MVNMFMDVCPAAGFSMLEFPTGRGSMLVNGGVGLQRQLLPTDPQGTATLSVSGFLPGSEVRLFTDTGEEVPGGVEESSSTQIVFTFSYYTTPKQGYLVIMKPGYRYLRIPFQLYKTNLAYTVLPSVDPAYIP